MYGMASCRGGGRGRGTLLIVFMCNGLDKKRNDFWRGWRGKLLRVKNAIQCGREGGGGWVRGDRGLTYCMHCIFYGASTRDHVSHGKRSAPQKGFTLGKGEESGRRGSTGGKGSPGKWSKVELFEIGRWRGRLSEGILKNRTRTTVKIMES